ncbi:MAG: type IX secretion system membrane protein PorP/SprF [Flavobacteriaceae bacterium]|nr:type IX secretion system membrane protein PorP/SprF [Flavobacteriaceae bacterium]
MIIRMNMIRILILFVVPFVLTAQQDVQYTSYMYNMGAINPAYTSHNIGVVNMGGIYRSQWSNIEGSPKTNTFFARTPISEVTTIGLSYLGDKIGSTYIKKISGDYAYSLKLSKKSKLSLGIKIGISTVSVNFGEVLLASGDINTDPAFSNYNNKSSTSVGVGAFYVINNFYYGLSVPSIVNNQDKLYYFTNSGYVFDIANIVKIKPSFMLKGAFDNSFVLDSSINVLFMETIEAGISYRFKDSISLIGCVEVLKNMKIGYSYDYTVSDLGSFNSGSHEFFVLYNLDIFNLSKGYDKSPRYF